MDWLIQWYQKHTQLTHILFLVGTGAIAAYTNYQPFHDLVTSAYAHVPAWGQTLFATGIWLYSWYRNGQKKTS